MPTAEELLSGLSTEVKGLSGDAQLKFKEIGLRLQELEQRADSHKFGGGDSNKSIGQTVIESDGFKSLQNGAPTSGKIKIEPEAFKTALINAVGQNQPLVQSDRTPIVPLPTRRLTIRQALPSSATSSNLIEVVKENSFTNNAAPQYSAGAYENVTKAESALAFSLSPIGVSTIAHWIPISRQLLDDAPAIQGYVNGRLLYGLNLKIETELLTGSGIQGHLSGLVTNSTTYDTSYTTTASDTYLDVLRKAALQLSLGDFNPDLVIVNTLDWDTVVGTKETGSGISSGSYIWAAAPAFMPRTQVWGMNVVVTNSMTSGQFLVLDSSYCTVFDRAPATVEISREHSDYFTRNMAALLVETRLALAVYNTGAVLFGGFPFGS